MTDKRTKRGEITITVYDSGMDIEGKLNDDVLDHNLHNDYVRDWLGRVSPDRYEDISEDEIDKLYAHKAHKKSHKKHDKKDK